ncbi:MAG: hypothetical protein FJZ64_03285 [Chlamydiae bacterium]|nr:hypothetical protein [Chlamydiota bacterium]
MEGKIQIASEMALKFFSLSEEATLHHLYWDLFEDDFFGFSMKEALNFGIPQRLIYKSHRFLELEISTTFTFSDPRFQGMILIAKDLTEKQKLKKQISRNEEMKDLGENTAQIVHEIRNLLGGMRGFASLLEKDLHEAPPLQMMASSIIEGVKLLEKLSASILHYARPIQVHPASKEVGAFLKEFAKFIKVDPAFPRQVKMELHIPNDPVLLPLDPEAMKSALLNLAFNAIQAMPNGGVLSISLFKLEGCCQISITDTGVGIAPELLSCLFSPSFTTKKKGNGLGLVETKKIVQAHFGTIDVRSMIGKGSTFTITLPLKR